ncbi:LysM peptidoglycan-binding domain-containing protein [Lactobacillus melliventris]|uniref:LysM peptidoglycan-binding domain-containing protein n=1 Tax=Lactobacillus melliventris TaxID=1218507 RepID=UPI00164F1D61|nr:LysM domain-containing protein [Lactobacillus melliventris]MBC6349832.1 LysM domain-containing protein [Lactobacillus melliventris]
MTNNPKGPYQHYKRPQKTRVETYNSVSKGWIVLIVLLIMILIGLVPVVHHLAANNNSSNRIVEVRKTHKKAAKKANVKASPAKNKLVENKTKSKPKAKPKPKVKHKKKQVKTKQYIVQSGDSLSSIARRFKISVGQLAELNQLDPNSQVDIGQVLRIK